MIGCIIQARMGSSRLPGKVMMNLDRKNPAIYYVLEQLRHCKNLDDIVVATTRLLIKSLRNFYQTSMTMYQTQLKEHSRMEQR